MRRNHHRADDVGVLVKTFSVWGDVMKLNLVGAAIRYPHRYLYWIDMFSMNMNHAQAQAFQVALGAKNNWAWFVEMLMMGLGHVDMNKAMLDYNQALKNLERLEQM